MNNYNRLWMPDNLTGCYEKKKRMNKSYFKITFLTILNRVAKNNRNHKIKTLF